MLLLQQMIILFLLMMVGFGLKKTGLINTTGVKTLSAVVVNVANPAMVLAASINKENTIQGMELARTFGLILIVYVILIILAWVLTRVLRVPLGQRGTYQNMTVFSNIGFMGFPLVSAMFGSEAMLYASLFTIPYNILIYTYAYVMMDHDRADICKTGITPEESAPTTSSATTSIAPGINAGPDTPTTSSATTSIASGINAGRTAPEKCNTHTSPSHPSVSDTLKKIFNIGMIASILTIIIYLTRVPVPKFIESTVTYLSNLTAPLSMIVIGASMADMKLRDMCTDVRLLIFSGLKLLLIPIVGVLLIKLTGASALFVGVCVIMLGTPVGSMTAMLAQTHDSNAELASRGVALTTVLSVVTLPVVSMILGF